MADRLLLESGTPDGYLLEDSSGVLLRDAQMAYRGGASTIGEGQQGTFPRHLIPHLQNGDIVLALMHKDQASAGGSFSASSGTTGWTKHKENLWSSGGRNHGAALFYKVITDVTAEPTSWQFESSYSDTWTLAVVAFTNGDTGSPIDVAAAETAGQDSANPDAPDLTTVTDGALVVTINASTALAASMTYGAPSGFTSAVNAMSPGQSMAQVAYKLEATAGAKTYGAWTNGGILDSAAEYIAWTLGLTPAVSQVATPATASLAITAFAPTVTSTANQVVTPGVASLALVAFAPTVTAGSSVTTTPDTATLTITAYAPAALAPRLVTPGAATLAITPYAPTVASTANQTVTPGTAALSLAGLAPTVTASDHKTVTPGTASLSTSAFAPTVQTPQLVTPPTASLTITTFAPGVGSPRQAVPDTASLSLATFAPTITVTANQTVTPGTANLTLSALQATVSTPRVVTPSVAALTLTALQPTITATAPITATPSVGSLVLATLQPTVTTTAHLTVTPAAASLALTAADPLVIATANQLVTPGTAALNLTPFVPLAGTPLPPGLAAAIASRALSARAADLGASAAASPVVPGSRVDELLPSATVTALRSRA